jgi:hypothetical protein
MSLHGQLNEPIDAVLDCARRVTELSISLPTWHGFRDELRQVGRDLPYLIATAIAAFGRYEALVPALKHALDDVQEDAVRMLEWATNAADELQRLFVAIGTADDSGSASLRYGEARRSYFEEAESHRQRVLKSCNRAYLVAYRSCAAAVALDQGGSEQVLPDPPAGHNLYNFDDDSARLTWPGAATGLYLRGGMERALVREMAHAAQRALDKVTAALDTDDSAYFTLQNRVNNKLRDSGAPFHFASQGKIVRVVPEVFQPRRSKPADGRRRGSRRRGKRK